MNETPIIRGRGHIRDVTGQKFHKLTARTPVHGRSKSCYWDCLCECGNTTVVRIDHLLHGTIKSCGCESRTWGHGHTRDGKVSPEYSVWAGMLRRCFNPRDRSYKDYGERGITVCKEWRKYENFFRDMGPRPSPKHTLERKDNNGDYCKENCVWALRRDQNRNYRRNNLITYNGETLCITDWAIRYGLKPWLLRQRLNRDRWPIEKALNTPAR